MAWKSPNGVLSYHNGTSLQVKRLWVNTVSQAIKLSASKSQSRHAAFVYPRSYAPGDLVIEGICENQTIYQELSLYIRTHQKAIVDSPVTDRFARLHNGNTTGYHRLLLLSIPTEGIMQRGWIDSFSIENKGVFDPAPTYSFNFFVVFDQMSEDIGISHQIKAVYDSDDNIYASRKTPSPPSTAPEPGERDYPDIRPIDPIEINPPRGT